MSVNSRLLSRQSAVGGRAFMKRAERHHLKENELQVLARQAREAVEGRGREATVVITAVVVVGAIVLGYVAWGDRVQARAGAMLSGGMGGTPNPLGAPISPRTPRAGARVASA